MIALEQRGVSPEMLANALSIDVERASTMLTTHEASLSVDEAWKVEALAGASFATLMIEGSYVRHRDHPERIADLERMRHTLYANLDIRVPLGVLPSSAAVMSPRAKRRRKVS